ncbi:MAG: hypothetical protein GC201_04400 [Alphaproteobacteria bacterium]|nr:hypothetical protein [Alphaproteobacteria bacterium]
MIYAIAMALALLLATTGLHFEGLRLTYRGVLGLGGSNRRKVVLAMLCVFFVHLAEIALYAAAYWFADQVIDIGGFAGPHVSAPGASFYFFFSAQTYTTLGLGDVYPTGPLRLLASIEPINGLLLLGWSASLTYYLMQRFWEQDRRGL